MREIRQSGSEGGARLIPRSYPYPLGAGRFAGFRATDEADGVGGLFDEGVAVGGEPELGDGLAFDHADGFLAGGDVPEADDAVLAAGGEGASVVGQGKGVEALALGTGNGDGAAGGHFPEANGS